LAHHRWKQTACLRPQGLEIISPSSLQNRNVKLKIQINIFIWLNNETTLQPFGARIKCMVLKIQINMLIWGNNMTTFQIFGARIKCMGYFAKDWKFLWSHDAALIKIPVSYTSHQVFISSANRLRTSCGIKVCKVL
jgi:hypothetical protein